MSRAGSNMMFDSGLATACQADRAALCADVEVVRGLRLCHEARDMCVRAPREFLVAELWKVVRERAASAEGMPLACRVRKKLVRGLPRSAPRPMSGAAEHLLLCCAAQTAPHPACRAVGACVMYGAAVRHAGHGTRAALPHAMPSAPPPPSSLAHSIAALQQNACRAPRGSSAASRTTAAASAPSALRPCLTMR